MPMIKTKTVSKEEKINYGIESMRWKAKINWELVVEEFWEKVNNDNDITYVAIGKGHIHMSENVNRLKQGAQ